MCRAKATKKNIFSLRLLTGWKSILLQIRFEPIRFLLGSAYFQCSYSYLLIQCWLREIGRLETCAHTSNVSIYAFGCKSGSGTDDASNYFSRIFNTMGHCPWNPCKRNSFLFSISIWNQLVHLISCEWNIILFIYWKPSQQLNSREMEKITCEMRWCISYRR